MKKALVLGVFGALLPLVPARAVVLEQKWKAGQQLSYETTLRGTANLTAPAGANFPLAGVPLEVPIRGTGLVQLQTLSVDAAGVGTLTMRVPQFNLTGQAFGQNGQLTLQENTSRVTLNGRPIKLGDGTNPLAQPPFSLQISPQGRFVGFQPLAPKTAPAATTTPANPVEPAAALDRTAMMTAAVVRALPALWPGRDVQVGEKWKAEISLPAAPATTVPPTTTAPATPPATAPATTAAPTAARPLGTWNMTFKGAEEVEGRTLQRVGVVGQVALDSTQTPAAQRAAGTASGKIKQDVRGDLWLDAAAGQIVRADLTLGVQAEGGQNEEQKARMNFIGTLQLNLKP